MKSIFALVVFLAITAAAAATGSLFRPGEWYFELVRPSWTPPGWLFGPVWAVLYVMIAIAGWRVWTAAGFGGALVVWFISLGLNAAWSFLMFGQQQIDLAAIDIVALWCSIVAFIWLARPVDRVAALLFVPYLAWVSFAGVLNLTIYALN